MAEGTIVGLYGTLGVPDTLASNTATIYEIGEDLVYRNLMILLEAHNRIVMDLMDNFVTPTSVKLMRYGGTFTMDMDELDEHGTPDAQKGMVGSLVGFPLRKYGRGIQWTRSYFEEATGADFNAQLTGMLDGDVLNVIRQLKKALFNPTNYNFIDKLVRSVESYPLPIKALVNADGAPIPPGPNGEYFDPSTHTHYLGATSAGTYSEADCVSALQTVLEHFKSGKALIYINQAQETAMRGFADFQKLYDTSVNVGANLTYAKGDLDVVQIYNRRIGTYHGADVWVKPWMPAGYQLTVMSGQEKVLAWRRAPRKPDTFTLTYENEAYPLRARTYERNFGLGVYNRVAASILDTAHTTYTAPTIT
jgi:hypothetical protein